VAAHATSLAVIVPTSLLGSWRFHRQGNVVWPVALPVGAAAAVAAVIVSRVAPLADPGLLRLGFGVLLLASAARLLRASRTDAAAGPPERDPPRPHAAAAVGVGGAIGGFSALLGVGGGIVGIPLLLGVLRVGLRRVAGTSMAIVAVTSVAGAAAYMLATPPAPIRPGWSAGWVDLPVALVMSAGTLLSVASGAALNRRLETPALARVFAALLALAGVRLVIGNLGF
jgi:uncharacterized protein